MYVCVYVWLDVRMYIHMHIQMYVHIYWRCPIKVGRSLELGTPIAGEFHAVWAAAHSWALGAWEVWPLFN